MFGTARLSIRLLASTTAAVVSFAAWGATLEGDYSGKGSGFFEKLSFRKGGKVRVTFAGMTKVGTFEVDGKEVLITVGNETNVFTIDDQGCVVGGGILGKYCKGGDVQQGTDKPAKGQKPGTGTAAQSGGAATRLSGVYKAGNPEVVIALNFKTADKVTISVSGTRAKKESTDATYKVAGDQVTIRAPDGSPPLVLTRKGNTLEGAPEGETMKLKFVRQ